MSTPQIHSNSFLYIRSVRIMLSTQSIKVMRMSIERDSRTELSAETILERHNSYMAVAIHLLISSCMNSLVVIDFLMMVRIMFSVNWYILRWNFFIISFKHIRAILVTPERKLLRLCSNSFKILVITSYVISSRWN